VRHLHTRTCLADGRISGGELGLPPCGMLKSLSETPHFFDHIKCVPYSNRDGKYEYLGREPHRIHSNHICGQPFLEHLHPKISGLP
jgi:hypothetical protein